MPEHLSDTENMRQRRSSVLAISAALGYWMAVGSACRVNSLDRDGKTECVSCVAVLFQLRLVGIDINRY